MNAPLSTQSLIMAAIVVLICWRVFRRVRRLIGRQEVHVPRLTMTAVFFPLLIVLVTLPSVHNIPLIEGVVAGIVAGVALGLLGLRLTRFEATTAGFFYRPNTLLGVAISLLFIGRLIYRFGSIYLATGGFDPKAMQTFGSSPLTLALFGVVAAYYTTFALGVLSWYRKARDETASAASIVEPPLG
jgi:hypothetical protein